MCAKAALHCVLPRAAPPALPLTALPCCRRWRGPASFAPCQPKPGRTCWCFWWSCWSWRPAKARPSTVRRRGRPQSSRCRRCSPRLSLSLAGASSWPASPGSPREQTAITSPSVPPTSPVGPAAAAEAVWRHGSRAGPVTSIRSLPPLACPTGVRNETVQSIAAAADLGLNLIRTAACACRRPPAPVCAGLPAVLQHSMPPLPIAASPRR